MKRTILPLIILLLAACDVHKIPIMPHIYDDFVGTKYSIGILKCTQHKVNESDSFVRTYELANFIDSIRELNLFSTVKCVENINAGVDFVIQPIQLLKIKDEHSCSLDNKMIITIGTVGLISTGCTTSYDSSVLLIDPHSTKEYTINYQHLEKRRNGFPGFFSRYLKDWVKYEEPLLISTYYKCLAIEIYKNIAEIKKAS